VKLLFDQNLSPRLPSKLADLYPGSQHVRELGNCPIETIETLLRQRFADIQNFSEGEATHLMLP
jgi:predicted nuclease of predicted toxin-antitoxin system